MLIHINNILSVSYTHLQYEDAMYREEMHYKDIYYEEAEKQNKEAVSYTHLDVYKRQAIACYKWLLSQGWFGSQIVLAGDSAGGGLAMCLTMYCLLYTSRCV